MTAQRVLCINAGSSSLRVTVAEREGDGPLRAVAGATVERIGGDALIADEDGERIVDAPDQSLCSRTARACCSIVDVILEG